MIGQGVYSIFVMIFVFFIPESPRWLLANGRREEALAFCGSTTCSRVATFSHI